MREAKRRTRAGKITAPDKDGWVIEHSVERGITMSPGYAAWFKNQYEAMSDDQRRKLRPRTGMSFEKLILCEMCELKTDDPIAATESLQRKLASGAVRLEAEVVNFKYPSSFWRWLSEDRFMAAYQRGFFNAEECAELWRCLGWDDPPPYHRFPEGLAAKIRQTLWDG